MVKVCALTSGRFVPSSRFRVRQHIAPLQTLGVDVREVLPRIDKYSDLPGYGARLNLRATLPPVYWGWAAVRLMTRLSQVLESRGAYDVVWLEREFQPGLPSFEPFVGKPLVFDVDDAIWLKRPLGEQLCRSVARRADTIIAGNQFIADWFSQHTTAVQVIPTAIDMERFLPREIASQDRFTIGWTGTSSGFGYLYAIENAFVAFFERRPDAVLHVVADRPPRFSRLSPRNIQFTVWDESSEADVVRDFSVGIMPLADDDWSRGKCAFKLLQYMASGIPIIASPIGTNLEVLSRLGEAGFPASNENDWYDAFEFLYLNPHTWSDLGNQGVTVVRDTYSIKVVADQLATIFAQYT